MGSQLLQEFQGGKNCAPSASGDLAKRPSLIAPLVELERAFTAFCDLSFRQQMPLPVITIQTQGRKNALGWFWKEKWRHDEPLTLPEINICAEYLGRDVEEIAQVLLHEMCHYANYLEGIRDCSSSQYHNRNFKRRCDSIGLVCIKGKRGWAYTSLSPELQDIVRKVKLASEAFNVYRTGAENRVHSGSASAPERRFLRWTCECKPKPQIVYGSKSTRVVCPGCLTEFKQTTKEAIPDWLPTT